MKKKLMVIFLGLLVFSRVQALTTDDGISYTILDNNTIQIDGYTGSSTSLTIPSSIDGHSVESLKEAAFYNCKLTSVAIPGSIKKVTRGSFANCSSLTQVNLGSGIEELGNYAFQGTKMSSITFPKTLKKIGLGVFFNNSALTSITIPENVEEINGTPAYYATNVQSFAVDSKNTHFIAVDGVIFDKAKTKIVAFPPSKYVTNTTYSIPTTVKEIGAYSFSGNKYIKTLSIPSSVETISDGAFLQMSGITTLTIPSSVKEIGDFMAQDSLNLERVDVNASFENTPYMMVANCPKLKEINLNGNITNSSSRLAYYNSALETINYNGQVKKLSAYTITGCPNLKTVKIPNTVEYVNKNFIYESASDVVYSIPSGLSKTESGNYMILDSVNVEGGSYNYDYAKEVLTLVNQERSKQGLSALSLDNSLTESAMIRAREISLYFAHERLTGESCFTIHEKASGENIARGQSTPTTVMESWMNSPGHKANILGGSYKSIGIGVYQDSRGTLGWVQLFSYEDAQSALQTTGTKKQNDFTAKVARSLITDIDAYYIKKSLNAQEESELNYVTIKIGDYYRRVKPSSMNFKSSNTSILSVDNTGKVKGIMGGNASVIVSIGNVKQSIDFEVIQPQIIYNNINYADVFDYEYYLNHNSDVANKYKTTNGYDYPKVLAHFVNNGMKEGRQGKETFNVYLYQANYADLYKKYGSDLKSYYMHFINHGAKEGRNASTLNFAYVRDGINYARILDINYYIANNSDVATKYKKGNIYNYTGIFNHFVNNGMKEGRKSKGDFDVFIYQANYVDIYKKYGSDLKSYYLHYAKNGYRENRNATTLKFAYVRDGLDYSKVLDINYYITNNSDVAAKYKRSGRYNYIGIFNHFINNGMKEGRKSSATFNVKVYKANYKDLQNKYGNDLKSYYIHYIKYGYKEGRKAI